MDLQRAFDKVNLTFFSETVKSRTLRRDCENNPKLSSKFKAIYRLQRVALYHWSLARREYSSFLLYSSLCEDIPQVLKHTRSPFFADNLKIFREIKTVTDTEKLADDIRTFEI